MYTILKLRPLGEKVSVWKIKSKIVCADSILSVHYIWTSKHFKIPSGGSWKCQSLSGFIFYTFPLHKVIDSYFEILFPMLFFSFPLLFQIASSKVVIEMFVVFVSDLGVYQQKQPIINSTVLGLQWQHRTGAAWMPHAWKEVTLNRCAILPDCPVLGSASHELHCFLVPIS